MAPPMEGPVHVGVGEVDLKGDLNRPEAGGLVLFAHGSGSSRHSPRNTSVAGVLRERGLSTLLFDLLTEREDKTYETRFDIDLLTDRLTGATDWVRSSEGLEGAPIGFFGSSTGAAAALLEAAARDDIGAVVSRGGRVDLAASVLVDVAIPTRFIVGGADTQVLERNREVLGALAREKALAVVEEAVHLLEGPGELEEVAELAASWFTEHLGQSSAPVGFTPDAGRWAATSQLCSSSA
ncbi:MAG: dienelactone hydrolase family protein [Halobacteriales archaeon]